MPTVTLNSSDDITYQNGVANNNTTDSQGEAVSKGTVNLDAYIKWDVSSIGSAVTAAYVELYLSSTASTTVSYNAYQCTSTWDQTSPPGSEPSYSVLLGTYTPITTGAYLRIISDGATFRTLVANWKTGATANNGIAMPWESQTVSWSWQSKEASGNFPHLVVTYTTAPNVPTNLLSELPSRTSIGLVWTAPAAGDAPTGYKVEYATNSSFTGSTTVDVGNVTSYTITGLANATQYWIRVRAYNAAGDGSNTSSINTTTPSATGAWVIQLKQTYIAATGAGTRSVSLDFTAAAGSTLVVGIAGTKDLSFVTGTPSGFTSAQQQQVASTVCVDTRTKKAAGGEKTFSYTWNDGTAGVVLVAFELGGTDTRFGNVTGGHASADGYDTGNGATANATTAQPGAVTPQAKGDVLIGGDGKTGNTHMTATGSTLTWTTLADVSGGAVGHTWAYALATAALVSENPTFGTGSSAQSHAVVQVAIAGYGVGIPVRPPQSWRPNLNRRSPR